MFAKLAQAMRRLIKRAPGASNTLAVGVAFCALVSALVVGLLVGCGGTSVGRATPLQVLSAAVTMNPSDYKGACSGKQDITFTAKLSANSNNLGGDVHYSWRIGYSVSDGVVTFQKGQTEKTLTRTASLAIAPEGDPYLAVGFATSKPNTVAAPETRFDIACSVPLTITEVSVTVQPWTANCGPHAFGFAAVLTAPARNVGGEVRYSWWFRTGGSQSGSVIFAPGQTTQTVVAAQTYNIQRSMALSSSSVDADVGRASEAQLVTSQRANSQAAPSPTSRREPAPSPTPAPQPAATPLPWPSAGPGGVYGVFSVTSPNAISDDAWVTVSC